MTSRSMTDLRFLLLIMILSQKVSEEMTKGRPSSRASCLACNAVAALYLSPLYSKEAMVAAVRTVCISFRIQTPRVCRGLVEAYKDHLDFIRRNTKLNRQEMCGVFFGIDCARTVSPYLNWSLSIPIDERSVSANSYRRRMKRSVEEYSDPLLLPGVTNQLIQTSTPLFPIVQITDIHIDPYYTVGAMSGCGEPLCCRESRGAMNPNKKAGIWGDYNNCDTPVGSLKSALEHISANHADASYWMWTGDITPHDIWNITRDEVIFQIRLVTDMIKQHAKVPVFPVLGNHEAVPVNSFPPPEVKGDLSISWLYDECAKQWSYWLPEDAVETLR